MNRLPLEGYRVLDLTRALSGPFCTMILADLGADVVKVEALPAGDMIRGWGPFADSESVYFLSTNRNKRSIAIDFRKERGLRLVKQLALKSDIVVENFKSETMRTMGLDFEELRAENPRLIFGSISGYGNGGPYESYPGFDQIAQGMSGLMSLTGDDSAQYRVGIPIGDLAAGMWCCIGILAAAMQQRADGHGQKVETSLLASLIGMLTFQGQRYLTLGQSPSPVGNDHPLLAPYGMFMTKDGLMNIAAGTDAIWTKLCRALGAPELATLPEFADNFGRKANAHRLKGMLEERLRSRTRREWTHILMEAGVPAGPINGVADALTDPHVVESGRIDSVEHPTLGTVHQLANPISFGSHAAPLTRTPPPVLGEHSVEILREAGLQSAEIQELIGQGIVGAPSSTAAAPNGRGSAKASPDARIKVGAEEALTR